eukprot:1215980-Prymnesium_polylepis.1
MRLDDVGTISSIRTSEEGGAKLSIDRPPTQRSAEQRQQPSLGRGAPKRGCCVPDGAALEQGGRAHTRGDGRAQRHLRRRHGDDGDAVRAVKCAKPRIEDSDRTADRGRRQGG